MSTSIENKVKEVIALALVINLEYITEDTVVDNDSLGIIQLVISIEDEFSIVIKDKEVNALHTAKELIAIVKLKLTEHTALKIV